MNEDINTALEAVEELVNEAVHSRWFDRVFDERLAERWGDIEEAAQEERDSKEETLPGLEISEEEYQNILNKHVDLVMDPEMDKAMDESTPDE